MLEGSGDTEKIQEGMKRVNMICTEEGVEDGQSLGNECVRQTMPSVGPVEKLKIEKAVLMVGAALV